jgi:hypothetical protein
MFAGIKNAKRGFNNVKLTEGDYIVRIDRCDTFETDIMGECYKVQLTILAALDGPHKEGEVVTIIHSMQSAKTKTQWFANIKSFIGGVMNVTDDQIDEAATAATLHQDLGGQNILGGTIFRIKAVRRLSKKSRDERGNPFEYSAYSWGVALENAEIVQALGAERIKKFFPNGL